MNDDFIIKYFKYNNIIKYSKLKKCSNEIIDYLNNRYNDSESLEETIYRICENIEIRPICIICGNKLKFNLKRKFGNCCSKECTSKLRVQHIKQVLIKKYGVDNCQKVKEIKEKTKKTYMEKYGFDNPAKSQIIKEKSKQTCLKKYGTEYYTQTDEQKEKSKQTCLKKYRVEYSFQSDNNKEKTKQTCLKKYGKEYFFQTNQFKEKSKQTCLERYGVENTSQINEQKEKSKQTCLERYGDENYRNGKKANQTKIEKYGETNTLKNKINAHSKEANLKRVETKRKNHTFNQSKPEDESYILLKEKYPDIIRQYRSELYPFNCDFYIPSLDLYIECNYHWTHGGKIYEGTKEDNKLLQEWKNKQTQYYDNAIKTWTYYDVEKNKIAKQNNLNYIIFWNINKLKNFLLLNCK